MHELKPSVLDLNFSLPSDVETNISYIANWTGKTENFNHWHEQVRNLKYALKKCKEWIESCLVEGKLKRSASRWNEQVNQGKCIVCIAYCTLAKFHQPLNWNEELVSFPRENFLKSKTMFICIKSVSNVKELQKSKSMLIKQQISGNPNIYTKCCSAKPRGGSSCSPHINWLWFNWVWIFS